MPRKTSTRDGRAVEDFLASMRPRPDAAENPYRSGTSANVNQGFNEAAARCRGKPGHVDINVGHLTSFNEAAARCRGKRSKRGSWGTW